MRINSVFLKLLILGAKGSCCFLVYFLVHSGSLQGDLEVVFFISKFAPEYVKKTQGNKSQQLKLGILIGPFVHNINDFRKTIILITITILYFYLHK